MIRFAGKEITSLQDFSYVLGGHKPGDVVEVVVTRGGQPVTVQVKLEMPR